MKLKKFCNQPEIRELIVKLNKIGCFDDTIFYKAFEDTNDQQVYLLDEDYYESFNDDDKSLYCKIKNMMSKDTLVFEDIASLDIFMSVIKFLHTHKETIFWEKLFDFADDKNIIIPKDLIVSIFGNKEIRDLTLDFAHDRYSTISYVFNYGYTYDEEFLEEIFEECQADVLHTHVVSEEFLERHLKGLVPIDGVRSVIEYMTWEELAQCQTLSEAFIERHLNDIGDDEDFWNIVINKKMVSKSFIDRNMSKASYQ